MHVLRAEKGYPIIGQDTDGTVSPHDLGLGWAVSKKKTDFVGRRSFARAANHDPARKQLVSLLPTDATTKLPEGSQIVAFQRRRGPPAAPGADARPRHVQLPLGRARPAVRARTRAGRPRAPRRGRPRPRRRRAGARRDRRDRPGRPGRSPPRWLTRSSPPIPSRPTARRSRPSPTTSRPPGSTSPSSSSRSPRPSTCASTPPPSDPAALADVVGGPLPTQPNTWTALADGRAVWLGPDEWLLTGDRPAGAWEEALRAVVGPVGGAAVDVSDQRTGLLLRGTGARELLAAGCALDLRPASFPPGSAAQTLLGQSGVLLTAHDGGFRLTVRTSFAGYVADWLLDAATEFRPTDQQRAEA